MRMRHSLLFFSFLMVFLSCTKEVNSPVDTSKGIPDAVLQSMAKNFPTAYEIQFTELVKEELWHVDFKADNQPNEAVINKDGKLQEWGVKKNNAGFAPVVLQDVIQKYIDVNYPNASVLSVTDKYDFNSKEKVGQSVYLLMDNRNYVLEFDLLGAFISVIEIDANKGSLDEWSKWEIKDLASIPENIKVYLDGKHATYALYSGTGVKGPNDYVAYYITIKIEELLYAYEFDGGANVLSLIEYNLKDNGTVNGNFTENITEAAQIPAGIVSYMEKNYTGWQYVKGYKTYNDKKEIIEYVLVLLVQNEYYYVYFDGNEQFQKAEKGGTSGSGGGNTQENIKDASEIPAGILAYMNDKFSGWTYLKGYVQYNANGEKIEYLLVIQVVDDLYYVTFDGKENFTGAKKG